MILYNNKKDFNSEGLKNIFDFVFRDQLNIKNIHNFVFSNYQVTYNYEPEYIKKTQNLIESMIERRSILEAIKNTGEVESTSIQKKRL